MRTAQRDAGVAEQFADEMREEHRRRVDLSSLSKIGEISRPSGEFGSTSARV
jgi:hypothetical protein